ncbi:Uncharacterised protein [Vibrio cholerae]|uniref:Uncharacterized protein n=1 Tax=Vibrio cholerae TaxID=666 RepID=A0A656AYQ6_VIBCL|nr:Uncharacterised protein [Vibrio cholerae]
MDSSTIAFIVPGSGSFLNGITIKCLPTFFAMSEKTLSARPSSKVLTLMTGKDNLIGISSLSICCVISLIAYPLNKFRLVDHLTS